MSNTIISINKGVKRYSFGTAYEEIIRSLSIDVVRGEYVSILGTSGCGKTTLRTLLG
jgi:ABC-type Fe3+/spermidine/putrescine transport system ATPase subunit